MTETAGEVTFRKRACDCQFADRDISRETCPQHLLGTQLLPHLETLLWNARELGRTAMLLQSVSAEHRLQAAPGFCFVVNRPDLAQRADVIGQMDRTILPPTCRLWPYVLI